MAKSKPRARAHEGRLGQKSLRSLTAALFGRGPRGERFEREPEQFSYARVFGSRVPFQRGALARADAHRNLPVRIVIRVIGLEIILVERKADHLARGFQAAASTTSLDFGNKRQGKIKRQGCRNAGGTLSHELDGLNWGRQWMP